MLISDSYRKELLIPAWRFEASGVIWRLLPAGRDRIVGEERDLVKKSVKFFCLEESTGAIAWKERSYGENWWTGMEAVEDGVLYLHGFATPSLPVHRGIVAVDVVTGTRLWEEKNFRFLRARGPKLLIEAADQSGSRILEMDSRSGRILEQSQSGGRVQDYSSEQRPDAGVMSPLPLQFLQVISPAMMTAIEGQTGPQTRPPEALLAGGFLAISFHDAPGRESRTENLVNLFLLVIELASGKEVYRDRLVAGVPDSALPTFFVRNHILYYVQDRTKLLAVRLPEEGC